MQNLISFFDRLKKLYYTIRLDYARLTVIILRILGSVILQLIFDFYTSIGRTTIIIFFSVSNYVRVENIYLKHFLRDSFRMRNYN